MTSHGGSADPGTLLPLKPAVFQILVSLADEERHGYAIIKEVERRTDGEVVILAGALYRFLGRMLEDDLIRESEERPAPEADDTRRRYYHITDFGRAVAVAEVDRLERLLRDAKAVRLHPETVR
ncbi:MAG: PadR family transcriptional regulator [Longimicrobiales bacterium]